MSHPKESKPRRRWWTWLKRLILLIVVIGGWWLAKLIWFKPLNINHFYERVFLEFAIKNPELLTQIGILDGMGLRFHNDDLTDSSPAFTRAMADKVEKDLATLRSYSRDKQSPQQQLSTDILEWFLDNTIQGHAYLFHDYPVNQLFGVQSSLPDFMVNAHRLEDERGAKDYIKRLQKFTPKFEQVLEGITLREEQDVIPPRFVIERVLTEMRNFRQPPPNEHFLYTNIEEKLSKLDSMSDQTRDALLDQVSQAIETSVYPAYDRLIETFERLEPKATTDDGVWKLPDGEAYYAYQLRQHTTTDMSAEEIHQLGLEEVARIESEMRTILTELGVTGKSVGEHMTDLTKDERFQFPNTDEGREAAIARYQDLINEMDENISTLFDLKPEIGVEVKRIPPFKEATSPGAYYNPPAMDGSRPGVFFANLRDMKEIPRWSMPTLAYHEAVPGHHFQLAIQQEIMGVPTFRKLLPFTAYTEGWALYAEYLAFEGGYLTDPYDNLGRLRDEMFRAVRLVVDTGIHQKRWNRQQAIDYMMSYTGMPASEVVSEIERYIVNPGQACAYKVGQLKILALRDKAKSALGDQFDIKRFHNVMLANGSVPLSILERLVDTYIQETKTGS